MVLEYVPLLFVGAAWFAVSVTPVSERLDRIVNRLSLRLFGPYARRRIESNRRQVRQLRAAHVETTYRVYASKTFLLASLAALTGSILGAYGVVGVYRFLRETNPGLVQSLPPSVGQFVVGGPPAFSVVELFVVFLASSATLGVVAAVSTYQLRWSLPAYRARERARRIDVSLERNVAFMYALSRSGMSFAEIFRILARNRDVYGETAAEVAIAVKDIDLFGTDVVTAIERMGRRTPSDDLSDFAENLASVMQSGRSLPRFLHAEYEYYSEEAEAKQEQFLELLATLAEAYVTILVAGPLFLITILVIIGLVTGGTLLFLQLIAYLVLPLATLAFVVYLDSITDPTEVGTRSTDVATGGVWFTDVDVTPSSDATAEGERRRENRYRHRLWKRLQPVVRTLRDPLRIALDRPRKVFTVTVPVVLLAMVGWWWPVLAVGIPDPRVFDDGLVLATLFLLGTFSAFYEVKRYRIRNVEANVPDFLDRLASTNEAGMPVVESFGRIVESDLGALTPELQRTWADVRWGARLETALRRFRDRLRTPAVTRVVALTTNAMSASGDVGPVLRIAADEAKASRRLDRDRHNEMVTYLVVIYLSFFVFLTIIVALEVIFVPQIPSGFASGGVGSGLGTGGLPETGSDAAASAGKDAYSLVFFHTALVQGVCSGLVAGQMGENSVEAGAKHAFVMLAIAYGVFVLVA